MVYIVNLPRHVGIIMDGNGRWANLRGLPRIEGHKRGVERVKDIVKASLEIGIEVLTLYAFSVENWRRPIEEVSMLMDILYTYLSEEMLEMLEKGIKFKTIGDITKLPSYIQDIILKAENITSTGEKLTLVTALSYSGRDEILRAIKKALNMNVNAVEIDEKFFEGLLDTAGLPPVDLIIRTSGEKRISNFLLWQAAYAELYFTETFWPDFTKEEFICAIQDYQRRERRFGMVLSEARL